MAFGLGIVSLLADTSIQMQKHAFDEKVDEMHDSIEQIDEVDIQEADGRTRGQLAKSVWVMAPPFS
jgi:hypothetical protein